VSVPRVFGHLELAIEVANGSARARLRPLAVTRLIEERAVGLDPERLVRLVSRICGVCSIAHQLAAIEAVEAVARFEPSESVDALRGAALRIHAIQNAALFLALVAFEELTSFVSRPREARKKLLEINNLCCRALQLLAGGAVHPVKIAIGGFRDLSQHRIKLAREAVASVEKVSAELAEELLLPSNSFRFRATPLRVPNFISRKSIEAWRTSSWVELELSHELVEKVLEIEPPPFTGARARSIGASAPLVAAENPWYSIPTRLAEIPKLAREAVELLDACTTRLSIERVRIDSGAGVAAVEAPRGVLIHAYEFEKGVVRKCRIATPTQISLRFLERCSEALAKHLASRGASLAEIERSVQSLVRSFDPCIPCAVKVIRVG